VRYQSGYVAPSDRELAVAWEWREFLPYEEPDHDLNRAAKGSHAGADVAPGRRVVVERA